MYVPTEGAYFCSSKCAAALGQPQSTHEGTDDGAECEDLEPLVDDGDTEDANHGAGHPEEQIDAPFDVDNELESDQQKIPSEGGEDNQSLSGGGLGGGAEPRIGELDADPVLPVAHSKEQLRKLLEDGQRIMMAFKQSAHDGVGSWWGGLVGPTSDDDNLVIVSFDDGELRVFTVEELAGMYDMGKYACLSPNVECGLVDDTPSKTMAVALCPFKAAKRVYYVGVFLGDSVSQLCKHPLYHAHVVCEEALQKAVKACSAAGARPQPTRSCTAAVNNHDKGDMLGYRTFRRGDIVEWTAGGDDVVEVVRETVYAILFIEHQKQHRRFIITFSEEANAFSVNAWSSWRVVSPDNAKDKNHRSEEGNNEAVLRASAEGMQRMLKHWPSDPISRLKSVDQLQKASLLGPATVNQRRIAERKAAECKRKQEARKKKTEKEEKIRAAQRSLVEQARADENETRRDNRASTTSITKETAAGKQHAVEEAHHVPVQLQDEAQPPRQPLHAHMDSTKGVPRKTSSQECEESEEDLKRRIEDEELAAFMKANKESILRQQCRSRLHAELQQANTDARIPSPYHQWSALQSEMARSQLNNQHAMPSAPMPVPSSIKHQRSYMHDYDFEVLESIHNIKRKIARLEGEQRVHRVEHREGELEALRFDLQTYIRRGLMLQQHM